MVGQAMIRKEGDKWVLYTSDGKRKLGTHDTREDAVKQEEAIEAQKHKGSSSRTIDFLKKIGLLTLMLGACAPKPLPPEGQFTVVVTATHCSTLDRLCPDGGCCPEEDACGGTPGCPPNVCCYTGHHWWDVIPGERREYNRSR